ncbi:hypothetical protein IAU59_001679 [Kwoniella sp. CBS 9459]
MAVATQTLPSLSHHSSPSTDDWSRPSWATGSSDSQPSDSYGTQLTRPQAASLSDISKRWRERRQLVPRSGNGDISSQRPTNAKLSGSEHSSGDTRIAERQRGTFAPPKHRLSSEATHPSSLQYGTASGNAGLLAFGNPLRQGRARGTSRAAKLTAQFKSSVATWSEIKAQSGGTSPRESTIRSGARDVTEYEYRSSVWEKASDWAKNIKATQGGFCINGGERIDVSELDEDVMTAAAMELLLQHEARKQSTGRNVHTMAQENETSGVTSVTHFGDTWALGYQTKGRASAM